MVSIHERCICAIYSRDYAKRINVDFILMNKNNDRMHNTWNQLQFLDYLKYYDRIAYIDGDCYIPKYCYHNFLIMYQQII